MKDISNLKTMKKIAICLSLILVFFTFAANAQKEAKPSEILKPYTQCVFSDDLRIVKVDKMYSGKNRPRAVTTADGEKGVSRLASYRVMIKYPKHDYYMANIRPEVSAANEYEADKKTVIEWLTYLADGDKEFSSKEGLFKKEVNGFEIYNYNRRDFFFESRKSKKNPTGGVDSVGTAVIFSDPDKTITTIYFFNTKKPKKNPIGFDSIQEWTVARDNFFESYTSCIDQNRSTK